MIRFGLLTVATLFSFAARSQTPTLVASGLLNPSKIIVGPRGTLLISEAGTKDPNTGRISIVDASGHVRTLLDHLPSGASAPNNEPDGPNGMVLAGNTLYVAIGEGDTLRPGTTPGTTVPNPAGPSAPILDSLLAVTFNERVDLLATPFSLQAADYTTLFEGNSVRLTNSSGDVAVVSPMTFFRTLPDPRTIYRNSHPYGLGRLTTMPRFLYMTDAGLNTLVQVDLQTGRSKTITHFANIQTVTPGGPPVAEAVPTSVRPYNNLLLVTLFSGFPFYPGDSRIVTVDPATGKQTLYITFLSSAIDVVFRQRPNGAPQIFVLQYSTAMTSGAPGNLLVYNSPAPQVVASGLKTPSAMALETETNMMYILSRADGTVSKISVGPAQ